MDFGLGLVLSFTDNATTGINSAVNSLMNMTRMAENASKTLGNISSVTSLSALSVVANQVGNSFMQMSSGIMGLFQKVITKVKDTGTQFQSLRVTLGALMKDGDKAETALSKLMNFASTTPFEIKDLTGMFTTITANGLDAFQELKGASTGVTESLMSAIGDLMAFRPDVPAQQWGLAIRNAFSGEVRSLKNALDINVADMLGRKWGKTAEQVAQDFMDLADALGVAGMMKANMGTLQQTLSNVADQFTRIFLAIADTGLFNVLQDAVVTLAGALGELQGKKLDAFAKSIGDALMFIISPIANVTKKIAKMITAFTDFIAQNPLIAKIVVTIIALTGVLFGIVGVALKVVSAIAGLCLMMLVMGIEFKDLGVLIKTGVRKMLLTILPLIAIMGLLYVAWKTDFAGIRTLLTGLVSNLYSSFNLARNTVNSSVSDMIRTIDALRNKGDFFSNLSISIMKFMTIFKAMGEAWNSYTLSGDTFEKAKALGILPFIEALLDLKYRFDLFKEGFMQGWRNVSVKVQAFIAGMADKLDGTIFQSILDKATEFFQMLSGGDAQSWYDFGEKFAEFTAKALVFFVALKSIDKVVGILLAVGSAFKVVFGIFKGIGIAIKVLSKFSAILKVFNILRTVIMAVLPAITAVVTAIGIVPILIGAAIIALVVLIYKFRDQIWNFLKAVGTAIANFCSNIFSPIAKAFMTYVYPIIAKVGEIVAKIFEILGVLVGLVYTYVIKPLLDKIKWLFSVIGEFLGNYISGVVERARNVFNALKTIFSPFVGFMKGVVDAVCGFFLGMGKVIAQGIGDFVKFAINSLLNKVSNFINGFIAGLNLAIGVLNAIPGVSIKKVEYLSLPKLAKGGIVDKPTVSVIGEAGKEAVVPLENNTEWISGIASKLSSSLNSFNKGGDSTIISLVSSCVSVLTTIARNMGAINPQAEPIGTNLTPSSTLQSMPSNTSTKQYLTTSNNNTTTQGNIDNSVTFAEGSIVINTTGNTEDAEKIAKKVIAYIKRHQELEKMTNYN